jgi:hypothetical protein
VSGIKVYDFMPVLNFGVLPNYLLEPYKAYKKLREDLFYASMHLFLYALNVLYGSSN